jgi:hypothetical protein
VNVSDARIGYKDFFAFFYVRPLGLLTFIVICQEYFNIFLMSVMVLPIGLQRIDIGIINKVIKNPQGFLLEGFSMTAL